MSITSRRVTRMVTAILLATGYLLLLVPTSSLLAAQKSNEFPKVLEAEQGFLIRHSHDWIETPRLMQPPPGGAPVDIVEDGSFEAGSPNPFWLEESTGFGTPLCTVAQCGTDGGTGPFSGTWWAWFGGIDEFEEGAVGQTIQGDPGDRCTLSFYLEIPISSGNSTDFLKVSIEGAQVFVVFENSPGYSTYTRVDIDVSDYIDGQINTLRFDSTISGTPHLADFFVDDVAITCKPFVDDFESGNSCNWTSSVPGIGCPPAGWTCDPESYGFDDGCDCGCGVFDPDCLSQSATSCSFCNEIGSCDTTGLGCPGIIDPLDNAICSSVP